MVALITWQAENLLSLCIAAPLSSISPLQALVWLHEAAELSDPAQLTCHLGYLFARLATA